MPRGEDKGVSVTFFGWAFALLLGGLITGYLMLAHVDTEIRDKLANQSERLAVIETKLDLAAKKLTYREDVRKLIWKLHDSDILPAMMSEQSESLLFTDPKVFREKYPEAAKRFAYDFETLERKHAEIEEETRRLKSPQ